MVGDGMQWQTIFLFFLSTFPVLAALYSVIRFLHDKRLHDADRAPIRPLKPPPVASFVLIIDEGIKARV